MVTSLALASAGVVAAVVARGTVGDGWLWLVFNLALAWVPLGLGRVCARGPRELAAFGPWWLLFLPNAPYLMTDLVHLEARPPVPLWFDAALLGGAGALGLAIGATSLVEVAAAVSRHVGRRAGTAVWVLVPPLCGLAMQIGRFSRWNSWDIATRPLGLLADLAAQVADPRAHASEWAFALTYGTLFAAACLVSDRPVTTR